jgi:peptidoglycan-associated lipoprotein
MLLVLFLLLCPPSPAWAGSASPAFVALNHSDAATETIPDGVYTDTALEALNRLVFRYEMVHFNTDSSVLLPAGQRALRRKTRWLQAHPEATVTIEGHCDERGSAAYNMELGDRRAAAARAFLMEQGIAPHRIRVVSWGKTRPDVTGKGESVWYYNRRAECLPK